MLSWLSAVALAFLIGFVSIRGWWIERKGRLIAERRVVERPNSFYASKAVHNQEDEEWWRGIELERLHELNREYVERLLRQIAGAGVGSVPEVSRAVAIPARTQAMTGTTAHSISRRSRNMTTAATATGTSAQAQINPPCHTASARSGSSAK